MVQDLSKTENWVVVDGDHVQEFKTFQEAVNFPKGHLMTKTYYEYHYKNILEV
jgi:hypothetical protein